MTGAELPRLADRRGGSIDPASVSTAVDDYLAVVDQLDPVAADERHAVLELRRRRATWLVRWEIVDGAVTVLTRLALAGTLIAAAVHLAG
jgi:hypothetical protein